MRKLSSFSFLLKFTSGSVMPGPTLPLSPTPTLGVSPGYTALWHLIWFYLFRPHVVSGERVNPEFCFSFSKFLSFLMLHVSSHPPILFCCH